MTESTSDLQAAEAPIAPPPTTENPMVDAVLDAVAGVHELPLDQHVAVFEQAHEQLRGALDSPRS